ncbi:MAG: VOC family protein [Leptospirales bacterium]
MPDLPNLPNGYKFHHIGYATTSIENELGLFEFLGYRLDGNLFSDSVQGIAGCFLVGPGPCIELLENLPGSNTLTPWIKARVKMYHFAYQVDDINEAIDWARNQGAKVIVRPVPATAFMGCCISFMMFRSGLMVEFIEKGFLHSIQQ